MDSFQASRISPGVSRFKAEIQFNPIHVANRYIDSEPGNVEDTIMLFSLPRRPHLRGDDEVLLRREICVTIRPVQL